MVYTAGMALPKLTGTGRNITLTLDDDLTVTFQIAPIPGKRYQDIIEAHRGEDGKAAHEDVAVDMLDAGISHVYSSIESTPVEFTRDDAAELWETWPDWARWDTYRAVIAYSTQGPHADPFGRSKPNANADA